MRARWVAKGKQDARQARVVRVDAAIGGAESSAWSPPINVEEKLWHWLTCEERTSALPARRRVFFELPPDDYQVGDEHMCGLLQYSLYVTRDAAQNLEEEVTSDTQRSQI